MSSPSSNPTDMKSILKTLIHHPQDFTADDAEGAINYIMHGNATHSQISAFLVALRLQEKDADPIIVAACSKAMQSHARLIPYGHDDKHIEGNLVDIVGTGGDGHDTYNVSTTASIVAAGAGAKVAKVSQGVCHSWGYCSKPPSHVAWKQGGVIKIRLCRSYGSAWV